MGTVPQPPPMVITQPATIITRHPATSNQLNINISVTRGLAIAQIVIGALTFLLGIVVVATMRYYWANNSGTAIVAGIWIIVTGTLGIFSCQQNQNSCLNGTHMAFCTIATIGSFIDGCIFAAALGYYNNCEQYRWNHYYSYYYYERECSDYVDLGRGLYGTLLLLMILEFFVSLAASIYCCQASPSCCGTRTTGMILQQRQPQQVIITTTGQMPQQQPQQQYMNKVDFTQQPQPMMNQQPMVNQGGVMMYPPQTAITQAAYPPPNNPPPVYQENPDAVLPPYS